ncbi:uncharacterized protein C10orf105 homolog [Rhynchocyon petersi]
MSTEGPGLPSSPATLGTSVEAFDPLAMLIALACVFLLLATCLLFVTLCKPAALDPGLRAPRECMPHHPGSPSEPRLRVWKRLGSLRQPLHSLRPGRPAPQRTLPGPSGNNNSDSMESTEM